MSLLGHLWVIDFVQLDPSSERFKDCIIHEFEHVDSTSKKLLSRGYHYIGQESSEQPNNPGFVIQAILELIMHDKYRKDELIVIFADNGSFYWINFTVISIGPKEFNCSFITYLPELESKINEFTDTPKKIVINNFAENHGIIFLFVWEIFYLF